MISTRRFTPNSSSSCVLQAIVCPFSDGHRDESVVYLSSAEPLRDAYEVFAHSISFKMFDDIRYQQILKLVERRLSDDPVLRFSQSSARTLWIVTRMSGSTGYGYR